MRRAQAPASRPGMADEPSLVLKLAVLAVSTLGSLGVAELVVRAVDGGALPSPRLYVATAEPPGVALAADASARASGAGRVVTIATGPFGVRQPADVDPTWLVVGDSQALGLGVEGADTFAARLAVHGVRAWNAGVVGYGVEDALARADALLAARPFAGVVVAVNRVNDPDELGAPIDARFEVVDGWLLPPRAAVRPIYALGLGRLHLVSHAVRALAVGRAGDEAPPRWLVDPAADASLRRAWNVALAGFAARHPGLDVVVVELPVDVVRFPERRGRSSLGPRFPEADAARWRAWRVPLAGAGFRTVDVDAVLRPEHFLDGDYHLDEAGHAAVADALGPALAAPREER